MIGWKEKKSISRPAAYQHYLHYKYPVGTRHYVKSKEVKLLLITAEYCM